MYVSFLTTEGNDILIDQELFTGLALNETKIKTFNLPVLHQNIKVKLHIGTDPDGVVFSEVKITYKDNIHTFTTRNDTNNSGVGVDNTVGWMDGDDPNNNPPNRFYTNISY
uniref:Uncharacterized protein n=1 Tax=viral metagenome TaxID=1070528 RepID=A0A6C0L109_9ZZZZ